jgi:hypothetical protein
MKPGDVLGDRFELVALAGEGGMGLVFRGRDLRTGADVAVKLVRLGGDLARFEREARVLRALSHPAVVRYVAEGATPAGPYLVMQWLEGEDLAARLGRGTLSVAETLVLARRMGEALGAAHAAGVVHRDVKPANVFLVGGNVEVATLVDFGIAGVPHATRPLTRAGVVLGTPGYLAPEQLRAGGVATPRSDVFALGCVLYECLAGRPAFEAESLLALLAKVALEEPPPLPPWTAVPAALAELVGRMLAKDPAARPADGREVTRALAGLPALEPAPRTVPPPSIGSAELRFVGIVLVEGEHLGDTLPADAAATVPALSLECLSRLEDLGARVVELRAGAAVAMVHGEGTAAGLAVRTARAALALRSAMPSAPMAAVVGRVEVGPRAPVGEAIDAAARLVALPAPDVQSGGALPVRIEASLSRVVGERFDVRTDGHGDVLVAERGALSGARKLLGKVTRFEGRDLELRMLEDAFGQCVRESEARAIVVVGPAGVGKSRLASELVDRIEAVDEAREIWTSRGDRTRAGSALELVAQALRPVLGVQLGAPEALQRRALEARVARAVPLADRRRVATFLGELVGTGRGADDDEPLRVARQNATVMGDQLRAAWLDFLAAELALGPVVLVLEDLHWSDATSVAYVDAALRTHVRRPFFVVALARPEIAAAHPDLWRGRGVHRLELRELSPRACERVVRSVLGEDVDAAVVDRVVSRSAGNAFFLEELVRAVAGGAPELPANVTATVEARLALLAPEDRRTLRAASVLGDVFWDGALRTLLGAEGEAPAVAASLDRLEREELVSRRVGARFPAQAEYEMRHGIVREVAYGMLTEADRRIGHALAAEWLERHGARDAAAVAEHYESGGLSERAIPLWVRAATDALEGDDLGAAWALAERGMARGAAGQARAALLAVQAEAASAQGRNAVAEDLASQVVALAGVESEIGARAAGTAVLSAGALGLGDRLVGWAERLLAALRAPNASPAVCEAAAKAAASLFQHGRPALANELLESVSAVAAQLPEESRVAARVHQARAARALAQGDVAAYARELEGAIGACERAGMRRSACVARIACGYGCVELGDHAGAVATLRVALADAEREGFLFARAVAQNNLGWALARRGELAEGARLEAEAIAAFGEQGDRRLEANSRIYAARIAAAMGDVEGGEANARRALELLGDASPLRAFALATLADLEARRGDAEAALRTSEEAMAVLEGEGAEEGEAFVRLVHAEILHAAGHVEAARAVVRRAWARVAERSEGIADAGARLAFLTSVPEHVRTEELARVWSVA